MEYQSFRGADLNEALSAVRASLGPDALIQSTRQVSNGRGGALGNTWVEVTAAPPTQRMQWPFSGPPTVVSPPSFASSRAAAATQRALSRMGGHTSVRERTPTLGLDPVQLARELESLRAMLNELNAARPPRERALALLAAAGLEGTLARRLATGAGRIARRSPTALLEWLQERLNACIEIGPDPIQQPGPQLIYCVGNTGVGKTTTLAKLAARARLDLGRTVAILSLDSFRVGAVEQWQRYASLMGIPFHPVRALDEVETRARESRAEILLVDTTGKSANATEEWLGPLSPDRTPQRNVSTLLTLPAWLRGRDAERIAALYRDCVPTGIVVTKLDETCQLGGVLHAAIPNRLPLTYLCDGPRVPEDIHAARADRVVEATFAECT